MRRVEPEVAGGLDARRLVRHMVDPGAGAVDAVFAALADPTLRAIVGRLARQGFGRRAGRAV